jgi:AraC-like DNA-binding protein
VRENLFYSENLQQFSSKNSSARFNSTNDGFLQGLYKVIEDNLDNPLLTVGFLAANMAVSKSTLNRRLSTLTGLSANELIKKYRLQKAIIFLMSGKNVSETAYLTGFEAPSYFTQCFKEFYKITPKKYSKNNLVTPLNIYGFERI